MKRFALLAAFLMAAMPCCGTITLEKGATLTINNYIQPPPSYFLSGSSGDSPVITPSATSTSSITSSGGMVLIQRIASPNMQVPVGVSIDVPVSAIPGQ